MHRGILSARKRLPRVGRLFFLASRRVTKTHTRHIPGVVLCSIVLLGCSILVLSARSAYAFTLLCNPTATPTAPASPTAIVSPTATVNPTATVSPTVTPTATGTPIAGLKTASAIVPAYWSNDQSLWSQLEQTHPAGTIAIANFNAGPPSASDGTFAQELTQAHQAGLRVVGYVHTSYGGRSLSAIDSDISGWYNYQVDGIFLDEVRADTANLPFYQQIASNIRARSGAGNLIISNPGWIPTTSQYLQTADIIMVYEGSANSLSSFQSQAPSWMSDPTHFAAIVEGTGSNQLDQILQQNVHAHVGYSYLIDTTQVYSRLPSFWSQETAILNSLPIS